MSFWNNITKIFRSRVGESGGSITVNTQGSAPRGSFPTTLNINDSSMLRQLEQAKRYRTFIDEAARASAIPVCVIAGIGSRESHWGLALRPPTPAGTGDFSSRNPRGTRTGRTPPDGGGFGRGLMQIDYDWHEFARTGNWQDPRQNLLYAAKVLNSASTFFKNKGLPNEHLLRAVLAAYNSGATATWNCWQAGQDLDCNTTGRDYSRDVLNRSGWFSLHGF
jgi:hypothetical protein